LCTAAYNARPCFTGADPVIDLNKPVRVFRNWKHDCYSIMQDGRLKASARQLRLCEVEFRVRQSGRLRMLRNRRKNVHAYAIGRLLDFVHPEEDRNLEGMGGRGVYYNPYEFSTFVDGETRFPVTFVSAAQFDERGVVYV